MRSDQIASVLAVISEQWIAVLALLVSASSLLIATLGYRRDRPRLKLEAVRFVSDYQPPSVQGLGYIKIKAINAGRRPIYLTVLWGRDANGEGRGFSLDYAGAGVKLGEGEFKEIKISHLRRGADAYDAVAHDEEGNAIEFDRLWIEDSIGIRHEVPGATPLLAALKNDYKKWCDVTGYWKAASPSLPPAS